MSDIPTYVVVPVIEVPDEPIWLEGAQSVTAYPNGCEGSELNLSAKWNMGLDWAAKQAAMRNAPLWNVAFLNDDIEVAPGFLPALAKGLREWAIQTSPRTLEARVLEAKIAYANVHNVREDTAFYSNEMAGQTMAGWAFMLRGELGYRFDEQFRWWYGDSDLERQVVKAGGVAVCVAAAHAKHLRPTESTRDNPELLALAKADEARYAAKWHIDPATLWLAMNPTWGET